MLGAGRRGSMASPPMAQKEHDMPRRTVTVTATLIITTAFGATAAAAGPGWANQRTLTCSDGLTRDALLTPAGFGTPFHIVASTSVFVPRVVTVDGTVVTILQPGATRDAIDELTCAYTDPSGRSVEVRGILTPP
jgi:hypothetical protein